MPGVRCPFQEFSFITDDCVVSSALESGIRGSVQLLLGLGLVDEAKAITQTFMARWIHI